MPDGIADIELRIIPDAEHVAGQFEIVVKIVRIDRAEQIPVCVYVVTVIVLLVRELETAEPGLAIIESELGGMVRLPRMEAPID